jgi:hypothetical protein
MSIEKVLYRAHAKATGGRDGRAVSSDNVLDLKPAGLRCAVSRAPGAAFCVTEQ